MGTKRIIVHEIVVNLRIPPYTKRWFKEDDKISIDTCLLFVLFPRKSKLRRTHFYGVAKVNVDFIVLVKVSASFTKVSYHTTVEMQLF